MDLADKAQELIESRLQDALALTKRETLTVPFSGFCLSCNEPVVERRFCDSDCREQHELSVKKSFGITRF